MNARLRPLAALAPLAALSALATLHPGPLAAQPWRAVSAARQAHSADSTLRVRVDYGVGRLRLAQAAPPLLYDLRLRYDEERFRPTHAFDASTKTLTVGVSQLQSRFVTDYPALMAGLLITSLPVIGAYLIFQRHLVRGIIAGAVK
jgi:hypothetical protein